jgi:hypothetical protein
VVTAIRGRDRRVVADKTVVRCHRDRALDDLGRS